LNLQKTAWFPAGPSSFDNIFPFIASATLVVKYLKKLKKQISREILPRKRRFHGI